MADTRQLGRSFAAFVEKVEPGLRRALVVSFGTRIGREACVDAMSWAWEHWARLEEMENPAGYLFRVGQTSARRELGRSHRPPGDPFRSGHLDSEVVPELMAALAGLSEQQKVAVVLVHGYGYSQTDVADLLGVSVSTLREHLRRGVDRLRRALEVSE